MHLFTSIFPGANEGIIRLFLPLAVMVVLLFITLIISSTQNNRMPNSICLTLIFCAVLMAVTKTSFLSLIDIVIGFVVSILVTIICISVFKSKNLPIRAPFIKYLSVLGLYLGLYNILNIILFSIIFGVTIWKTLYQIEKDPLKKYEVSNLAYAPFIIISSVLIAGIVVLIQLNIIPFSDSVLNLYPVL